MTKIAIIEDDQIIHQMYRMKFESEGFNVALADNGIQGISVVKDFKPDIILLDLQMPEMSGSEALAAIRKLPEGRDVPVIVLTNLGKEEAPKELKDLSVHSYIVKADLTPRQVIEHVKEALKK